MEKDDLLLFNKILSDSQRRPESVLRDDRVSASRRGDPTGATESLG
jgi:hypothetical protein